jgi:putative phage-type endonuclease
MRAWDLSSINVPNIQEPKMGLEWYLQFLKVVKSDLFVEPVSKRTLDIRKKKGRRIVIEQLLKYNSELPAKAVKQTLKTFAKDFGKIPAAIIVNNYPDLEKPEKLSKKQEKKVDANHKRIRYLKKLPQHAQRTPGWYKARQSCITASAAAAALGEDHYKKQFEFLLGKCGIDDGFTASADTYHGVKYEDVAIMIYEHRYDTEVDNFGMIPDPEHSEIGASPDGICSRRKKYTKGKSAKTGRMIEIKCVTRRIINTTGAVDGEICPHHYWIQVQLQLECCKLDDCDFWQCKIVEIPREEWKKEIGEAGMSRKTGQEMGCIIELMPRDKMQKGQFCKYEGKCLYPPSVGMSRKELDQWVKEQKHEIRNGKNFPDGEGDHWYDFHQVLYWRLEKSHCELIKRDQEWFKEAYPRLKKVWKYVEWLRKNTRALHLWHDYSNSKVRITNEEMMKVLDKMMGSSRYIRDLEKQLKKNPQRFTKNAPRIVYNSHDLSNLLDSDDDD